MWVTFPPFLSHSLHPMLLLVSWPGYVGSGVYTPVLAFDKMSHFSFFFLLAAFPSCSFHMDTSSPSESGSEIHFQGESRTLDVCPEMGHWAFPHPCPTVTFAALDFLSLCTSQLCFSSLGICLLFFFFCKPPLCFFSSCYRLAILSPCWSMFLKTNVGETIVCKCTK